MRLELEPIQHRGLLYTPAQNDWITQLDTGKELLEELGSLGYLLDALGNDHSSPWTVLKWLLRAQ